MDAFRRITVHDVDNFIQFPDTISVTTGSGTSTEEHLFLTVIQEDVVLQNYDRSFLVNDYAIYSSIRTSDFFNHNMDWKYVVENTVDIGTFVGSKVFDAHGSAAPLINPVINAAVSKVKLGTDSVDTRFTHYRQCDRFFKFSYRIGDIIQLPGGRKGNVYGVFLNSNSGDAIPYWSSVVSGQDPETILFYYADVDMYAGYGLTFDGHPVTVVCPPCPDFVASKDIASTSNNLVYTRDPSDNSLLIRTVGIPGLLYTYSQENFVAYDHDTDRELFIYMIVEPEAGMHYRGEYMVPMWSSKRLDTQWGPIRDLLDTEGNRLPSPAPSSAVRKVDRMTFTNAVQAQTFVPIAHGIRMHFPTSLFVTRYIEDTENENIQFAYDLANNNTYDGDTRKSILGGRIMQLVSAYMFDGYSDTELACFPQFLYESKAITDQIIDRLSSTLISSKVARNSIIDQIMVKYGKKHFIDKATRTSDRSSTGDMWAVLSGIQEFFIFFTTTINATISTIYKNRIDVVQIIEVPIVLRIYN